MCGCGHDKYNHEYSQGRITGEHMVNGSLVRDDVGGIETIGDCYMCNCKGFHADLRPATTNPMNDIEKRIEEIIKIYLQTTDEAYATSVPILAYNLGKLYHQLLSEERKRLIGVVVDLPTYYKEGAPMVKKAQLLATLNKEKD